MRSKRDGMTSDREEEGVAKDIFPERVDGAVKLGPRARPSRSWTLRSLSHVKSRRCHRRQQEGQTRGNGGRSPVCSGSLPHAVPASSNRNRNCLAVPASVPMGSLSDGRHSPQTRVPVGKRLRC